MAAPKTTWFPVGLLSSFPDIVSDPEDLTSLRFCNNDLRPGCKVFHAPSGTGPEAAREVNLDDERDMVSNVLRDQVVIFKYRGKIHAVDHQCPHSAYPLSRGSVFDIEDFGIVLSTGIMCPKHAWSFSLFSGMSDRNRYRLGVWEVQLRGVEGEEGSGLIGGEEEGDKEVWVRRKQRMG